MQLSDKQANDKNKTHLFDKLKPFLFRKQRRLKIQQEEVARILKQEKAKKHFQDINAENVLYLIGYEEDQYIVYIDADEELDWELEKEFGENDRDLEEQYNKAVAAVTVFQTRPSFKNAFTRKMRFSVLMLLGNVIINYDKKDVLDKLLKELRQYFSQREKEISRKWFCVSCFASLFGLTAARVFCCDMFKELFERNIYLSYGFLGMYGGIFSILLENGKRQFNCNAGKTTVVVDVLAKLLVSCFFAIIVTLAIDSGLCFSSLKESSNTFMETISLVAGFSERLAPSIIEKIDNHTSTDKE